MADNGGKAAPAGAAVGTGAVAVAVGVKEPTLYPGEETESTHMVLAVAHMGKVKLARGYGGKPGFFGEGPFLELPNGEVVSGVEGVVRAVALVSEQQRGRSVPDNITNMIPPINSPSSY